MRNTIKKHNFTLVELLVAMGVFTLLMLSLMQFFNGAQKLWTNTQKRTATFADARVAMNLIASQIQSAYYEGDGNSALVPFAAEVSSASTPDYDKIAFVADSPFVMDSSSASRLYEVAFVVDTADNNTLKIKFYSDDDFNWNFYGSGNASSLSDVVAETGTDNCKPVIPYVMSLNYECFDKSGANMKSGTTLASRFPYSVKITMSVLDKTTYEIWKQKGGISSLDNPSSCSSDALKYLNENKRTFSTMVYLGERGQG